MTKKEEKKSDLEWLLNSLIEKGWRPFGRTPKKHWWIYCMKTDMFEFWIKFYVDDLEWIWEFIAYEMPIRSVVSKESWLWQFVCENGMIGKTSKRWEQFNSDTGKFYWFYDDNSTYRLIESALCDGDKLEDFLLNSIKLD
jgi:hypothetical protein